jgi:antitoxin (DNA-binding transcriptional repressor) of toxin-antitoxin stability system
MPSIASRDLRNHTAAVLDRVRAGERVVVTVHGEAVAEIGPPPSTRPRFLTKADLVRVLSVATADRALLDDIADVAGQTTDELNLQ